MTFTQQTGASSVLYYLSLGLRVEQHRVLEGRAPQQAGAAGEWRQWEAVQGMRPWHLGPLGADGHGQVAERSRGRLWGLPNSQGPVGVDEGKEDEDGHREQHVLPVFLPKQLQLLLIAGGFAHQAVFLLLQRPPGLWAQLGSLEPGGHGLQVAATLGQLLL